MRLRKIFKFLLPVLFILAFAVLSKYEDRQMIRDLDFATTIKLQNHIPARFDSVWEDATIFVSPLFSIIFIILITITLFIKRGFRALIIPLLFCLLVLGELYGKSVVHHPAPPFFMIKNPTTIFPQFYVNEQYSYPSGHTARAVFLGLAFYLSFIIYHLSLKKELKVLIAIGIIAYISMVAIGRIYLGHHWLSDVIGGGLIGSGLGLLTAGLISPIIDRQ